MLNFNRETEFDWDAANVYKNEASHGVHYAECEEIFFNEPLIILADVTHSITENRYMVLGHTNAGRLLTCIVTMRDSKIRVISARDQHKKERGIYEQS